MVTVTPSAIATFHHANGIPVLCADGSMRQWEQQAFPKAWCVMAAQPFANIVSETHALNQRRVAAIAKPFKQIAVDHRTAQKSADAPAPVLIVAGRLVFDQRSRREMA